MSKSTAMNSNDEVNIRPANSILGDAEIPSGVTLANDLYDDQEETEQVHFPQVHLFFSFDIVNSTAYKAMTTNWPIIIKNLLDEIQLGVSRAYGTISPSKLWRVIGDEIIFDLAVHSEEVLCEAVSEIFEVTQKISMSLKSGKFFDTLPYHSLSTSEIIFLKNTNNLSVKTTAWLAAINEKADSPYDNIIVQYYTNFPNQIITEYLGKDIDAGFRLKNYTQDRRLCISLELAYYITKHGKCDNLHIMDYARLKGVWKDCLYPVIWYYDPGIIKQCQQRATGYGEAVPFANSFRYDETDNNPMVLKFFQRESLIKGKKGKKSKEGKDLKSEEDYLLAPSMYNPRHALDKIILDRNLEQKLSYITGCFSVGCATEGKDFYAPLQLHCAVVCCDVKNRRILIAHRCVEHKTYPGQWEFGCAKAKSCEQLSKTIEDHYHQLFDINLRLVKCKGRDEEQPLPLAVYEIPKSYQNINKGIIFIGEILNDVDLEKFRSDSTHDKIRWVTEDQINDFSVTDVVPDFKSTLSMVFSNFDTYFSKED